MVETITFELVTQSSHSLTVSCGHLQSLSRSLAVSRGLSRSLAVSRGLSRSLAVSRGLSQSLAVSRSLSWSLAVSHGCSRSLKIFYSLSWSLIILIRSETLMLDPSPLSTRLNNKHANIVNIRLFLPAKCCVCVYYKCC